MLAPDTYRCTVSGMDSHADRSQGFCVVKLSKRSAAWSPQYIAVLHDTSIEPFVSAGAGVIVDDRLSVAEAQQRANELNQRERG